MRSSMSARAICKQSIDVKNVFYIFFIKNAFSNVFNFLNVFYFLVAKFFILLNLLNSEIKRLLSDGFNTAAIGNSLTKSHKVLSDVVGLMHTKTIILLENIFIWFG